MSGTRWLSDREARAWRGYMKMRALLDLQISRDLARDAGLSEPDYTVLVVLSETPGGRVRLVDLADRMLWSTSRTAHHLDRMQRRDLVRREKHPTNSRATVVALTEHGQDVIEKAAPHHVDSVRRHFIDRLTAHEIDVFGDATETVLNHLRPGADPPGDRRHEREGSSGAPLRTLLAADSPSSVASLLTEDAVFHSPVATYTGREDVAHLLAAIAGVVRDIRVMHEFAGPARFASQFTGRVDGDAAEGMLMWRSDANGLVTEATLWLRPLAVLHRAVAQMRETLAHTPLPSTQDLAVDHSGRAQVEPA
jgi:DNA-binding MarR family transcriptional regulator